MSRKSRIEEIVRHYTEEAIKRNQLANSGIDTLYAAQLAGIDRSNASKELNQLWRDGFLIKIQDHPVLYLSRTVLIDLYHPEHLPAIILKGDSITNYLDEISVPQPQKKAHIDTLIGYNGSLSLAIRDGKAAICYPPYGMPLLIVGDPGVDKLPFARDLHEYAQIAGAKSESAQFIRLECVNYSNDQEFIHDLFGNKEDGNKGYLTSCNHGTVYLGGIERLSPQSKNAVADLIEHNGYTRPGESSFRPLTCSLIASIGPQYARDISFFRKYFPTQITIPDIDERGAYEKIEQILALFEHEAMSIKRTIRIFKDLLAIFAQQKYPDNMTGIRAEIKQACSRAYLTTSSQLSTIIVSYQHLSLKMLSEHENSAEMSAIRDVLGRIETDYIIFEPNGNCAALQKLEQLSQNADRARLDQFVDQLDTDSSSLEKTNDFITENISTIANCGNRQLQKIQASINPLVSRSFFHSIEGTEFENIQQQNPRLLMGLMLHLSHVVEKLLNKTTPEDLGKMEYSQEFFPEAFAMAQTITKHLNEVFHISMPDNENYFIAMYLDVAKKWIQRERVPLLIIAHGESIASQRKDQIKAQYSDFPVEAIDDQPGLQLNDLLELVKIRCNSLDHGLGILVAVDGMPFENISEYIVSTLHIRCRTISNFSMDQLWNIVEQIQQYHSLDQIVFEQKVRQENQGNQYQVPDNTHYSMIYRLTNEFLQPSLTFLYADKAVDALMISLSNILICLNRPYDNALATKFLCHCVNMIERVIKSEPLSYPKVNAFIRGHKELYETMEKNLRNINELYGITIPKEELAYIMEIFL